jgi:hypothetical protein
MMFVKSASKTMIVNGTPRSHRMPALAMIFSSLLFPGVFNHQMTSEFLRRAKI